jgi:hypothetical protein
MARQRFRNHGYIDGNNCRGGYKRKAKGSFKRVHDESPRYTRAAPGNRLVYNNFIELETDTER